jgi:hypothetical protein
MNEATDIVAGPNLLEQYGCGPIRFSGHQDALYERHLLFDDVIDPVNAGTRERFEAAARSVRDVLSQRWGERTTRAFCGCLHSSFAPVSVGQRRQSCL